MDFWRINQIINEDNSDLKYYFYFSYYRDIDIYLFSLDCNCFLLQALSKIFLIRRKETK